MSSTRRAKPGSELRQEKFASSRAYRKALLGNLVSKRAARVKTRAGRELIYFLHDLSLRETHERHPMCNLFAAWPACPVWPLSAHAEEAPFERVARELHAFFPDRCEAGTVRTLPAFLTRLCLDPTLCVEQAGVRGCADLFALLIEYKRRFEATATPRLAMTETARLVFEVCDYALSQRGMTLAEGTYRTGKSMAAQTFAQANLGRCRYVQLSSARDDASFFRSISHALGIAINAQMKASEMRGRIETTLRAGHLALIIDEADWIWPQSVRVKEAPARANWIMTGLVNQGVPVALIGSRNFSRMLANLERCQRTWGREQWDGRLRLHRILPERPTRDDLAAIVSAILPDGTEAMRLLLLGHALKSRIPVAALESAAARARCFADEAGRPLAFADLERAAIEAGTITEPTEAAPLPPRARRSTLAKSSRTRAPLATARESAHLLGAG